MLEKQHWNHGHILFLQLQGWTLDFDSTLLLGKWPSKCSRPDQFPLPKSLSIPPPLHPSFSQAAFRALSAFFSSTTYTLWKDISTFWLRSVLNLPGEHALIRVLGKQFTRKVILSMQQSGLLHERKFLFEDLNYPRQWRCTCIIQVVFCWWTFMILQFLQVNMSVLLRSDPWTPYLPDHQWLNSDQFHHFVQLYALLCNCHQV